MKKLRFAGMVVALCTVMCLCLTACGSKEQAAAEAEEAFVQTMEAFKSGDVDEIKTYCDIDAVDEDSELGSIILSSLGDVSYEVVSTEAASSKRVSINADITLIDASQVMTKYLESIAAMVSSEEYQNSIADMTQEDYRTLMNSKLSEVLTGGEIDTVTKNITVIMAKEDGSWRVDSSDLTELLVTNTLNAINQLKN